MYGMKGRCFGRRGQVWMSARDYGWGRGWRYEGEFGNEIATRPEWTRQEIVRDEPATPPPWAGFWRGHAQDMDAEARKRWLQAWREHLKERLAEVEAELRRLGA